MHDCSAWRDESVPFYRHPPQGRATSWRFLILAALVGTALIAGAVALVVFLPGELSTAPVMGP